MQRPKSKAVTIREIEKVVNRLLDNHESSFHEWLKGRLKNPRGDVSRLSSNASRKKGIEKSTQA